MTPGWWMTVTITLSFILFPLITYFTCGNCSTYCILYHSPSYVSCPNQIPQTCEHGCERVKKPDQKNVATHTVRWFCLFNKVAFWDHVLRKSLKTMVFFWYKNNIYSICDKPLSVPAKYISRFQPIIQTPDHKILQYIPST